MRNALMAMLAGLTLGLTGCASVETPGPATAETVWAVTADHRLVKFNGGQPQRLLDDKPLQGVPPGESVVGIDYRVARGVLFALTDAGRLFTIDTLAGQMRPVGAVAPTPLGGQPVAMDFNPAVDRIRVIHEGARNKRLHPDTGALVSTDPSLVYAAGDPHAGKVPQVVAAAYTYNKQDERLTTNYAIDRALGVLVIQGTREGVQPAISPNTGQLFTVGSLGLGPLTDVSFDIADLNNKALVVATTAQDGHPVLYELDLDTGAATRVGRLAVRGGIRGMAIEP